MKFTLREIEKYTENAPQYIAGLCFVQSGIETADIKPMVMWLRRKCADNEGLSYLLVTSSHDSKKRIERGIIRTKKRGRPKMFIKGTNTERHFHGLLISTNDSLDMSAIKNSLADYCKRRRKRRPNLRQQKVTETYKNGLPIISYMYRQMDEVKPYRSGNFDFGYFNNYLYGKYPDQLEQDF